MSWAPRKTFLKKTRAPSTHTTRGIEPGCYKTANMLAARIAAAESRDPELQRLRRLRASLAEAKAKIDVRPVSLADIEKQWKFDRLQGRATSYYALEEQVLVADLSYVATIHNQDVVMTAIERRRRELAWEVAQDFWPLQALDEAERLSVLLAAGVIPPAAPAPAKLPPPEMAAKYRVTVKRAAADADDDDDWEPDPEVLEAMESWKAVFTEEDQRRMTVAEVAGGNDTGYLEKGLKVNVVYGSAGSEKNKVPKYSGK